MPRADCNLRGIPGKPWRPIASSSNNYYLAHAQKRYRHIIYIYIYIYIYYIPIARAQCAIMSLALRRSATRYTHQRRCLAQLKAAACQTFAAQLKAAACQTFAGNIPGKPWRPIARTSNYYYYPAHTQKRDRHIYTGIYIYPSREPSAQS